MRNTFNGGMKATGLWASAPSTDKDTRHFNLGAWVMAEDVKVGMLVDDGRFPVSFKVAYVDDEDRLYIRFRPFHPKDLVVPNPMYKALRGTPVNIMEG